MRHRRGHRSRCRTEADAWRVRARVERFAEPALLLLLRERPTHGYELLEQLPDLLGERVDMGNLYRVLRSLEHDGIVLSTWNADSPGPARRSYELTDSGRRLLDEWVVALGDARDSISEFLARYEERR